jgi:hypothetical protein
MYIYISSSGQICPSFNHHPYLITLSLDHLTTWSQQAYITYTMDLVTPSLAPTNQTATVDEPNQTATNESLTALPSVPVFTALSMTAKG